MDIPVFHDDQHGTAIIVAAGLINACHLRGKEMSKVKVVFNGAGAAGIACLQMVLDAGVDKVRDIYIRFEIIIKLDIRKYMNSSNLLFEYIS